MLSCGTRCPATASVSSSCRSARSNPCVRPFSAEAIEHRAGEHAISSGPVSAGSWYKRANCFRFLIRDWAGQFTDAFDAVLTGAGIEVVNVLSCSARDAYAERPVRTARSGCTDCMLITGPRHLHAVLDE